MSDDPFAPPDPFGEGENLELSLDVDEGYKLAPKRPDEVVPESEANPSTQAPDSAPISKASSETGGRQPAQSQPARSQPGGTSSAPEASSEPYHGVVAEALLQRRLYIWAPPAVFLLGYLFMKAGGDGFVRIVFGMWLHELGHASSAWVTGHFAVPGPWRTSIEAEQSISVTLVLLGILGFVGYRAWIAERKITTYITAALGFSILVCTFGVSESSAQAAITFCGDAGMMIIGGLLVLTFWAPVGSHMHTGMLRWGFIVIGSLAYLDGVFTWWPARKDPSVIPYGEIEGVGLSDPTKLVDVSGWTQQELIDRHVWVILIVAALLVARWAYGVWRIQIQQQE